MTEVSGPQDYGFVDDRERAWAGPFLIDLATGEIRYHTERPGAQQVEDDPRRHVAIYYLPWALWDPDNPSDYFDGNGSLQIPDAAMTTLSEASSLLATWFRFGTE